MRVPELQPLRNTTIVVVGLGCLGAPSVLEFAKAGVGHIRLVDHDDVDPATTVRWPIGFSASGKQKAQALHDYIQDNYPYTESTPHHLRIGAIRQPGHKSPSQTTIVDEIINGASLIYDATAELGVQHFLSDYAWEKGITYIGVSGTMGGWGGKVFRVRPHHGSGCWFCYRLLCHEGTIKEPPSAPVNEPLVQPIGCADPTFTGAGFDMLQIGLAGVRLAVSTLCEGVSSGYPPSDWDAIHIRLRADNGSLIPPSYTAHMILPHRDCQIDHD
ncbi:MAG: ThiF family adenylyltransferase [Phycisphaeraceae bacterium]|nr:ThiF family adenylyltransferase [Phycisphaeraceae bacterium]